MKQKRLLRCFCGIIAILSLICTSCEQPIGIIDNGNKPSDTLNVIKYDTLPPTRVPWQCFITHLSSRNGVLKAHMGMVAYIDKQKDSIPYSSFNWIMLAETQDTLLPLGTYTMKQHDSLYIADDVTDNWSWGAEAQLWYKEKRRYYYKDAKAKIGRDSIGKYYMELFVQTEDGENLYVYCPTLLRSFRLENGEYMLFDYYSDYSAQDDY